MTRRTIRGARLGLILAALLATAPLTVIAETSKAPSGTTIGQAADDNVQDELDKELAARRKAMMEEASDALAETHVALKALDDGKKREALEALARATGKLELLVAREPDLALAPVDVDFVTHDLYATPDAVREARKEVEELLDEGKVQEARSLLSVLASEIVISVANLPLSTYPDAIKAISPLIDEGEIEEAKHALQLALNTMVVTKNVISLPVIRAQAALDEAQEVVRRDELSADDKKRVEALVQDAREQLEVAELLGYGTKRDHKQYRDSMVELEARIRDEKDTEGVFAALRKRLDGYRTSFFD